LNELLGLKFENEFWDERLGFLCKRNKLSKGVSEVRYFFMLNLLLGMYL